MLIGQAQDLPLQGWCRRASVGATLVVARCVENTAHGHLQSSEGGVSPAIRAVPQKRLLNPLGRGANRVAPAVVVPDFGDSAVRRHQRPHMPQPVYHIGAGIGRRASRLPSIPSAQPKPHLLQISFSSLSLVSVQLRHS